MASHIVISSLVALVFISTFLHTASASASNPTPTASAKSLKTYKAFIKNECSSTTYPKVCYNSLSPYASKIKINPLTLTKISITLALKAARIASSTLTKLSRKNLTHDETSVIADCGENVDETVDLVAQSADALAHLKGTTTSEERFQWDNIKTWMSAAITDEVTCTDELDELKVRPTLKNKIQSNVGYVASMNSNALHFVNMLSY